MASIWTPPPQQGLRLVAPDHRKGLAVFTLDGDDSTRLKTFNDISPGLQVPGVQTEFSGQSATTGAYNSESKHDLAIAEAIAIHTRLALLVVTVRGCVR